MTTPITLFSKRVADEDGESYTVFSIVNVPIQWDAVRIAEWLEDDYPATRCQHEHDCCGHYYARTACYTVVAGGDCFADTKEVLVRQVFVCNI